MRLLRYLLVVVSAGTAGFLIYVTVTDRHVPWFVYGWAAACVLNFVYLLLNHRPAGTFRLFRLWGLWLDAKEGELRARIGRNSNRERDQ